MICNKVDLVAGDFNGTAWRCLNRSGISSIDEFFRRLCDAYTARSPTYVGTRLFSQQQD